MHRLCAVGQEDRHLQNQMQAAVAIRLGILDIILALDERQVILPHEHIGHGINILNERADHADAADIIEVFHHGLQRNRKAAAFEFADDAARRLDAAFDRVDRAGFARKMGFIT